MEWFKAQSARTKLLLSFVLMCIVTAFVGYTGITNANDLNSKVGTLYDRDLLGISALREAQTHFVEVARDARQMMLASDPAAVRKAADDIEHDVNLLQGRLQFVQSRLATDEGKRIFSELVPTINHYSELVREMGDSVTKGRKSEGLERMAAAASIRVKAHETLNQLVILTEAVGTKTKTDTDLLYTRARNVAVGSIIGATILGLFIGLTFARWFGNALLATANIAHSVASAAQELSAASEAISSGAQEQAASIEETASTLEEITSAVKQNADNAQQAAQLASASREIADRGGRVVSEAVIAMKEVNQASLKITDITATIDRIAFQTNLLALNAAVEAARAGEQGRGFAVVATEVRNLAQRSADAAKEVKTLIEDSTKKVESGYKLVEASGDALQQIISSVKRVTDFVSEIAAASREQSTGINQVNKAVTQMDQVTQTNAAQTEELSGTAEELSHQGNKLLEVVSEFHIADNLSTSRQSPSHSSTRGRRPTSRRGIPVHTVQRVHANDADDSAVVRLRSPGKPNTGLDAEESELDSAFEEM